MQIPILNGIYADEKANFRTAYPKNLIPVSKKQGISNGYLRPADGIIEFGEGPGTDRGGIVWNNILYRVLGSSFGKIDTNGIFTVIGDIGKGNQCSFDYSFDRLGISSNGNLYYYDGSNLTQVTDGDLGYVKDFIWIDGYFMTTDGTNIVVTELNDPFSVNPLKYGSAEFDPDPIVGLLKFKDEPYAIGRYTIQLYDNIGGNLFPFQTNKGAVFTRGAIGTYCACVFMQMIAFLGSGREGTKIEPPAVWIGLNGQLEKISTREIDQILLNYTEDQLSLSIVETVFDKNHQFLYIHLPNQTLVYDGTASRLLEDPVWFILDSNNSTYRARNFIWCYNKFITGDPTSQKYGYMTDSISSHYNNSNEWEFNTNVLYNGSKGAIMHELELVCLPGRIAFGDDPVIYTSYSKDGETWSQEKIAKAGKQGDRTKRIHWLNQGYFKNYRIQKFRGTSDCHVSFARLEARIEALNV